MSTQQMVMQQTGKMAPTVIPRACPRAQLSAALRRLQQERGVLTDAFMRLRGDAADQPPLIAALLLRLLRLGRQNRAAEALCNAGLVARVPSD